MKVAGTQLGSGSAYNVISDETVHGNIFELVPRSWERLRSFIAERTVFGPDAKFEQRYIYPEQACREALTNAIAHRDYSIQNGIDVFIYEDRLEIKSPGALLSTLSIDSLKKLQGEHESRNALVARVLRENKVMRELGEGMKRMFEAMDLSELVEPVPYSNGISFTMTFVHESIFTREQRQWLEHFKDAELSRLQKRIVSLGMNGREISPAEIQKVMKTPDRDTYDREVTPLRKAGILAEIRTNRQAAQLAKARQLTNNAVARFKVVVEPSARMLHRIAEVSVPAERPNPKLEVFVGNLAETTTEQSLESLFNADLHGVGHVKRITIKRFPDSRQSRGYGFAELDSLQAVEAAIEKLNGVTVDGRTIVVDRPRASKR